MSDSLRVLAISDVEERSLYDFFCPEDWRDRVDLVVSCGDLNHAYLEFLVSVLNVPLLYVAGNHDTGYRKHPPEGCDDIDGRVVVVKGVRIAGLAGCLRYNAGPEEYQYTERQTDWRVRRLDWKMHRSRGVDIMVSHAAPLFDDATRDAPDPAHRGSLAYRRLLLHQRPALWLHGHNHLLSNWIPRVTTIDGVTVANAYGRYEVDVVKPTTLSVQTRSWRRPQQEERRSASISRASSSR